MPSNTQLPNSPEINIEIGLKYLNNNEALYVKVLTSFLTRYKDLNIKSLEEEALRSTLHTIKGLAATLGMESLSTHAQNLELSSTDLHLEAFDAALKSVISTLERTLYINNN